MLKKTRIYFFAAVILALTACKSGYNGQLLGVLDRPEWNPTIPYGMVNIPSGTLHIGQSDQDINNSNFQRVKSVSVAGFFMDETEITNNQYRQFVYWVRDSISREMLKKAGKDEYKPDDEEGNPGHLDYDKEIDMNDPETKDALKDLYYANNDQVWGRHEINPGKLVYHFEYINYKKAAVKIDATGGDNRAHNRNEFIDKRDQAVYPDTLCWVHDYTYSYNEPMTRNYFWHPAFDNYPVVGVNWKQAVAFTFWRTRFMNDYKEKVGDMYVDYFRLPTETEWEYAARGGRDQSPYPWGGPYMRNKKGCILANFKPGRGNYPDDGGLYTVKADAYFPNDYGLYCMAGNVAEWTNNQFMENAYSFEHDLNPDLEADIPSNNPQYPEVAKRKVVRGGSWKDIAYFCQTGTRTFEYQDTAKCYIGFRCVQTFLGRSIND